MLKEHRDFNNIKKYVMLGGAFALAAVIGSMWLGWHLALWVLVIGAVISTFSLNVSPVKFLRWQGAAKLDRYYHSELYTMVNDLTSRAGIAYSPDLYMVKSRVPNAFAIGSKEKPILGMTYGLISSLTDRELRGVLAHEISHIKNNDLFIKGLAASFGNLTNILSMIAKFLLPLAIFSFLLGFEFISITALLVFMFSPILNILLQLGLSRSMEFVADHDAATLTGDPMGLALALHHIDTMGKPWWRALNPVNYASLDWLRSHPNTRRRIEKLKAMGGSRNIDNFSTVYGHSIPSVFLRRRPSLWI